MDCSRLIIDGGEMCEQIDQRQRRDARVDLLEVIIDPSALSFNEPQDNPSRLSDFGGFSDRKQIVIQWWACMHGTKFVKYW